MSFTTRHVNKRLDNWSALFANSDGPSQSDRHSNDFSASRRTFFASQSAVAMAAALLPANADDASTAQTIVTMKDFVDPMGLFSIRVPKNYFTLRRSAKGDLPDAKTGQGRRGSSIFTAGDMAKAEVVAVERFPTRILLEENGIQATGDLSSFPKIGDPLAVAKLINFRRERDKPTQSKTIIVPESVAVSDNGKVLRFEARTEIEVQKPELLMEQYGVSQLFRITLAKATLQSQDENLMAVFASALEQDYRGADGVALQATVDSFTVIHPSNSP